MKFAVFGVGGASGYFGARLAEAGHEVGFIARGPHLDAIRRTGLRVDSVAGDFAIHPARAASDPAEIGPVDVVIVGVKAWQVPEAARAIGPLIGPGTVVIPIQNGVEAADQLAETIGRQHVLGGTAKLISFIAGPGHIRHVGVEPSITFGERDGTASERVLAVRRAFEAAKGVVASASENIEADTWAKFVLIASLGGVTAVARAPVGAVRSVPQTRRLLETAMREILAVARARGVGLAADLVETTMAYIDGLPPAGTISMQRDIMEGRPSELDNWSGAVVRLGGDAGVPTPTHAMIYAALLPLEARARGELGF